MTENPSADVVLRPPIPVMRPRAVSNIPLQDSIPGGLQYSLKLDGFRAVALRIESGIFLQSRSGRDLAPDFPEIARELRKLLPPGVVLDGELCAYRHGRLAFQELLRSHAARVQDDVPVYFIAFDLLSLPGHDLRNRPLRERWQLLGEVLRDSTRLAQRVLATTDVDKAAEWYEEMTDFGVEGIVAKSLNSPYSTRSSWAWRKIRHSNTQDARLIGLIGPGRRPEALVVELSDGRRVVTSPRLDNRQASQVSSIAMPDLGERGEVPGIGVIQVLKEHPLVEIREESGRHGAVRFVRFRSED